MGGLSSSVARRGVTLATTCALAIASMAATLDMASPANAATCPSPPPAGSLYFNGTQSEGVIKLGNRAKAEAASGTISCGLLNESTGDLTIPAEGVAYSPFTMKLFGFLPIEATLTADGASEGQLSPVKNAAGETIGYNASLTAPLTATMSFLGIAKCSVGPFSPTLTTGKSGSLQGHYLQGSLASSLAGTLVANEFTVPRIEASKTCAGFLAAISNLILGLPLPAGAASVTTHATLKPVLLPPTFAGLNSATTCHGGPVEPAESRYRLQWEPATDEVTQSSEIVYNIYQATTPGGENFLQPTYTTAPGATEFETPLVPTGAYFVVRSRDRAGLEDSSTVERQGENICE